MLMRQEFVQRVYVRGGRFHRLYEELLLLAVKKLIFECSESG